jgi:hypothetical protein
MIGGMSRPADRTVRAPGAHRAVAALANPVLGYFVAQLLVRVTSLPAAVTYAVCVGGGLVLGLRAWSSRVVLAEDRLRVHNTLASSKVPVVAVRRIADTGRVEWTTRDGRRVRLASESLRDPWWAFGLGRARYGLNREKVRSWIRTASREPAAEPGQAREAGPAAD